MWDVFNACIEYTFVPVNKPDENILSIYQNNAEYFMIAEGENATMNDVLNDIQARPQADTDFKKVYACIKKENQMIGVVDFLFGYPSEDCLYIGLFMLDKKFHNQGIGSRIIKMIQTKMGYAKIRLGVLEENAAALHFWKKQGFVEDGIRQIENNHGNMVSVIKMYWNGRGK